MRRMTHVRGRENLGVLADTPNRYPAAESNAAAETLMKLTPPIGISITPGVTRTETRGAYESVKKSFADYVSAQLERPSDQSAPPPADVAAFLSDHQTQIDRVRDHIATAGPIRWLMHFREGADAPIPNLLGFMSLSRVFTARALAKAANHDATAWDDLRAVWLLDRELWKRPELISQLIALAGTRYVNAAAIKMPLPVPSWLGELESHNYRRDLASAFQAQACSWTFTWRNELRKAKAKNVFAYPYVAASAIDAAERLRRETSRIVAMSKCNLSYVEPVSITRWNIIGRIVFPNLTEAWQRLYRFQAEREATSKVLALQSGETPPATSACSDGKWLISANSIRFDPPIPINSGVKYPLAYEVAH